MTRWIVLAVPVAGVADMARDAQTVAESLRLTRRPVVIWGRQGHSGVESAGLA